MSINVWVRGGNIDQALSVLRRKMTKDGVLKDLKKRRAAMSRGEKRRAKDNDARVRKARKQKKRAGAR